MGKLALLCFCLLMQRYSVPEAGHLGAAIWARLFGHDRFGAHFMGAGSFGR